MAEVQEITPRRLWERMRGSGSSHFAALDVRGGDYGVGGILRGSLNIPADTILAGDQEDLAPLRGYHAIACYCMYSQQRGPASARALARAFPEKELLVVAGGFTAIRRELEEDGAIIPEPILEP